MTGASQGADQFGTVHEVSDGLAEVAASTGSSDQLVVAEGLELRYGRHVAVAASSFTIPRVGAISVIGPNGSGKSTLLMALAGLVPIAAGTLAVLGESPIAARSRISFVLQATPVPQITPITVRRWWGWAGTRGWGGGEGSLQSIELRSQRPWQR